MDIVPRRLTQKEALKLHWEIVDGFDYLHSAKMTKIAQVAHFAKIYAERGWEALDYSSWEEYFEEEFNEELTKYKMKIEDRVASVAALRDNGMPDRKIAEILGVSRKTVQRDLANLRSRNTGTSSQKI